MQQGGHRICLTCGFVAAGAEETCPADGSRLNTMGRDPYIGTTIANKYEVISLLGRGGMSVVYKVRHLYMQRLEALKLLRLEMVSDADALQRFQKESHAISCLRHTNIITVLDFGVLEDETPFLAMEYLEGLDLGEVLKEKGRLSPDQAIPLFAQLCDGLYHAHGRGVIHRDIKPSNIIMTHDSNGLESPIIVDFGIAKLLDADGATLNKLTTTGQVFGSPLYMSPEQCSSKGADERTDIYSLGCMLYQALTGNPPIQGNSPVETMMRKLQDTPRPFAHFLPDHKIPKALESCVIKALARDPDDRYSNMNDFRKALLSAVHLPVTDLPSSAGANSQSRFQNRPDTKYGAAADTAEQTSSRSTESRRLLMQAQLRDDLGSEVAREGLRRPILQIALSLCILLIIGAIALVFFTPSNSRQNAPDGVVDLTVDGHGKRPRSNPAYADNTVAMVSKKQSVEADSRAGGFGVEAKAKARARADMPASPAALGGLAFSSQPARSRSAKTNSTFTSDCYLNSGDLDSWKSGSADLVDILESPMKQGDVGHFNLIAFTAAGDADLPVVAQQAARRLIDSGVARKVLDAKIANAGADNSIKVFVQTIELNMMDAVNPRHHAVSTIVYYMQGDHASALQVVPGSSGNKKASRFVAEKVLPSFRK